MLRLPKARKPSAPAAPKVSQSPKYTKDQIFHAKWLQHVELMNRKVRTNVPIQLQYIGRQNVIDYIKQIEMSMMTIPFNSVTWNTNPIFTKAMQQNKNGRKSIWYSTKRSTTTGYYVHTNPKTITAENLIESVLSTKFINTFNSEQYIQHGFINFISHPQMHKKIKHLLKNPLFFEKINTFVSKKNLIFIFKQ